MSPGDRELQVLRDAGALRWASAGATRASARRPLRVVAYRMLMLASALRLNP